MLLQVSALLAYMNLGRYTQTFVEEQISGDVLADLEDQLLRDDLKMVSGVQRLRLMKVIRGERSARHYLKDPPSYGMQINEL